MVNDCELLMVRKLFVCFLPIVKFQLFLLDGQIFHQSWPKDKGLSHRLQDSDYHLNSNIAE